MTTKYDNFIAELRALCKKHHVCLDFGYDGCEVWDMRVDDPTENTGFHQGDRTRDETSEQFLTTPLVVLLF